jgi:hypothetical protein
MACRQSYTDCIGLRRHVGAGSQLFWHQYVRAGKRCLPSGLDRSGLPAFAGSHSLSNHC